MTASELFPQLICRGCGHHGLSEATARVHRGTKGGLNHTPCCRGGKARTRDAKCALCGEEFDDLRENFKTGKVEKKTLAWRTHLRSQAGAHHERRQERRLRVTQ